MKRIISLSLGSSRQNFDRILHFAGQSIHITHYGVDYDEDLLFRLVAQYQGECDVLALSCIPAPVYIGRKTLRHRILNRLNQEVTQAPMVTGHLLRSTFFDWTLQHAIQHGELKIQNSTLTFLSGLTQFDALPALESQAKDIYFFDPCLQYQVPTALRGIKALRTYANITGRALQNHPITLPGQPIQLSALNLNPMVRKALQADYFIATSNVIRCFDLRDFADRTILLDDMNPELAADLRAAKVFNAFWLKPQIPGLGEDLPYSVIEALIQLCQDSDETLNQDDILEFLTTQRVNPRLQRLHPEREGSIRRFAFVIHPLSRRDLFRHPALKPLTWLPNSVQPWMEKGISKAPGVLYGQIKGIKSMADGSMAEGLIYTLFATPKEMLAANPDAIYARILAIADDAKKRGAEIIGLGAFTKIVGDAGVTIAQRSSIPVTTGNSLSAAATLWAARDAIVKLGFVSIGKDKHKKTQSKAMVIGATGSIGKVCARILADIFTDVVLVATNGARLMTLRDELQQTAPHCRLTVSTQPDRFAGQSDLIVIATSATEGGVLSIDRIKPGALVCDVGRPLTFTPAEAIRRPDVLIIESGEIELPGKVKLNCDIGLEASVVYACLAETALLALEGRLESFTLSRNINYRKVIEIYKMAKKHGARLATIRSPNGIVTDQEIELCREHALKALRGTRQPIVDKITRQAEALQPS
jgi:predicted amino acid dehydrogenase